MKKIHLVAVFAVLGFSVVSCSSDDNEVVSTTENKVKIKSQNVEMFSREADTIPVTDTIMLTTELLDGPGDDPIIVPPPPPKP